MDYDITIVGSGTNADIAAALRVIASQIEAGEHEAKVKAEGECEWEDANLETTLSLTEDEDDRDAIPVF